MPMKLVQLSFSLFFLNKYDAIKGKRSIYYFSFILFARADRSSFVPVPQMGDVLFFYEIVIPLHR